jgi:hypothetical protein
MSMSPSDPTPSTRLAPLLPEGPRSHSTITRIGLLVASGVLILLGVVFWLVPVVTGLPFYLAAVVTLSMASSRAARWMNRCEQHLPYRFRRWLRLVLRRRERKGRRDRRKRADRN